MIQFTKGDILQDESEALVNTVNCVGIMGRGVALQFKQAFPENFKAYAAACKREEVQPGHMFVFETGRLAPPRYIINFPTKRHWRGKSRMEDVEAGLRNLVAVVRERGIRSVALPPLGAGLGGLEWKKVRARIEAVLQDLSEVDVLVYEPHSDAAEAPVARRAEAPKMTPGRAALVGLIDCYLAGLLDPLVTLLEVHKLLYFLQEAGEPLRLRYTKAPYGPYAENLRHVLRAIEGYLVSGYYDGGDAPDKLLSLVPGAREDAAAFLEGCADTKERFNRVSKLVEGFESSFGMELLATVHWAAGRERAVGLDELVECIYAWGPHKRKFTRRQVALAADVLIAQGWMLPLRHGRA